MDILKCSGENCPLKDNCYRYTAKDSEYRQVYFRDVPYKDGKCDEYWEKQ